MSDNCLFSFVSTSFAYITIPWQKQKKKKNYLRQKINYNIYKIKLIYQLISMTIVEVTYSKQTSQKTIVFYEHLNQSKSHPAGREGEQRGTPIWEIGDTRRENKT